MLIHNKSRRAAKMKQIFWPNGIYFFMLCQPKKETYFKVIRIKLSTLMHLIFMRKMCFPFITCRKKRDKKMLNWLLLFWKKIIKNFVSPNLFNRHAAWKLAWFLISGLSKHRQKMREGWGLKRTSRVFSQFQSKVSELSGTPLKFLFSSKIFNVLLKNSCEVL